MKEWFENLKTWQQIIVVLGVSLIVMMVVLTIIVSEEERRQEALEPTPVPTATFTEREMQWMVIDALFTEEQCDALVTYYQDLRFEYSNEDAIKIIVREINDLGGNTDYNNMELTLQVCHAK